MKLKSACAITALVLLSAVAGVAQAADSASVTSSSASSAVPPAPADKGVVVFFRKSSFFGMPYWTNIREKDVAYGKLTNGVYFVQTLEPGVHEFTTSVLGKDAMKVQVDPGETYYVEGKITMAVVGYTVVMAPSDEASFQRALKGMKAARSEPAKVEAAKSEVANPEAGNSAAAAK